GPGLIIVDEEHDPSYKQDDPAPRYHGRDAAVMLANKISCPVILGSASPGIESYHNARSGRYKLLTLDQRPKSGYIMPEIVTLDMKREKISGDCSFLSYQLKKETETRVAAGGQVIFYLNRRGFSPRLKCRDCGEVPSCDDCGVTLTYHRAGQTLKCHFCDRIEPAPDRCPRCGGNEFIYVGHGTQRVEENLTRLFSGIRAERIDSDKAASKSGRLILGDFAGEKFDLLIGTQMVTKGLDIPGVTLVGVLSADIGLDMPDFRAAEKTYARLLQVAGRAGRGDRAGLVLIQTYYSDHPVIRFLAQGNYPDFYESVLLDRKELSYPPYSRLINITLTSEDEKELETQALAFRIKLEERLAGLNKDGVNEKTGFKLLGPSKAPMYKLRGFYRRRLIIKCGSVRKVVRRFETWEEAEKNYGLSSKIKPIFDIDPVNMM
ncbi:MAG: primosomal protein N', partial [FCB group bacterium]|nr:primosomal protein N' [FCB group bacterium]